LSVRPRRTVAAFVNRGNTSCKRTETLVRRLVVASQRLPADRSPNAAPLRNHRYRVAIGGNRSALSSNIASYKRCDRLHCHRRRKLKTALKTRTTRCRHYTKTTFARTRLPRVHRVRVRNDRNTVLRPVFRHTNPKRSDASTNRLIGNKMSYPRRSSAYRHTSERVRYVNGDHHYRIIVIVVVLPAVYTTGSGRRIVTMYCCQRDRCDAAADEKSPTH
jgi:hypothetical protein